MYFADVQKNPFRDVYLHAALHSLITQCFSLISIIPEHTYSRDTLTSAACCETKAKNKNELQSITDPCTQLDLYISEEK